MPFDTTRPLSLPSTAPNSLKQKSRSILWMQHQDGIHNWDKWENMFAATLRSQFSIEPSAPAPRVTRVPTPPAAPTAAPPPDDEAWRAAAMAAQQYTRSALNKFAREQGLDVDDKTAAGGSLWVRTDASDEQVNRVLTRWGFRNKPGKGWWK